MQMTRMVAIFPVALAAALLAPPAEAVQRAFVSVNGNDANAASGCPATAPCRWFFTAVTVVDPNGEVVALDTGPFGSVTLTRSISLTSAPGVYAGISVFAGNVSGVRIHTPGITVTLRGITINGQGGTNGIYMTAGAKLSVENSVISNFSSGQGVYVTTPAEVRIVDSLIRDNGYGALFSGGATATVSGSKFLGNTSEGIAVFGTMAGTTTRATVTDTVVTGGDFGIDAYAENASAVSEISIIRSTISDAVKGVTAEISGAGTAGVTISDSMVTGNATGLNQVGAGATVESLGNNTVRRNTENSFGTITTVAPM